MSLNVLWKQPDLRRQLLFTLLAVVIYRLASHIPLPGIPPGALEKAPEAALASGGLFQFANLISGGAILRVSIVALSVYPFITACGLLDTAEAVFPRLGEWKRYNREKVPLLRGILTLAFAVLGAIGGDGVILPQLGIGFEGVLTRITAVIVLAAGAMFTMWLALWIDSDGLGGGGWASGVNMIVLANILAAGPLDLVRLLSAGPLRFALLLLALALLVGPVLLVQGAQRRVPVQYARRVRGTRLYGGAHTYMPFPLMYGGLDAIETVYSFAAFGALIVGALAAWIPALGALLESWSAQPGAELGGLQLAPGELAGALAMFLGVALLTVFQADVGFTEGEYAENLRRAGGFVPDVQPGRPTDRYLRGIFMRITSFGALFLGLYSILPWLLRWALGLPQPVYVAWAVWTLCRIIVDYYRVIEARLAMLGYRDNILVR